MAHYSRFIGRSVVDYEHFQSFHRLGENGLYRRPQRQRSIISRYDDTDPYCHGLFYLSTSFSLPDTIVRMEAVPATTFS